jgi:hypothetical protein
VQVDRVVVVVSMRVIGWANVVHLVGGSTLHAARLGLLAGEGDPENAMGVDREAGAADVLLVTGRVDDNGVLWGACTLLENCPVLPYSFQPPRLVCSQRTEAAGVQWPHVEDVDTLHLSEHFETLKTGGLLSIGGNGTGLGTGWEKVLHALDLCNHALLAIDVRCHNCSRLLFGTTNIPIVGA